MCTKSRKPRRSRRLVYPTNTLTDCTQDVPPTLYARIVDFSGCAGALR